MKALSITLSLFLVVALVSTTNDASAEIIGADDFSEADNTAVNGKAADVAGGSWEAPGDQTIQGGVLDTDLVGQHAGSFLNLTRALGPGELLTMTFESAESAGTMFVNGGGYAGMSFFINGDERLFIGDPGNAAQNEDGWALDGFAGGGLPNYTGLSSEPVSGTWTYNYDTGLSTLTVSDGTTTAMTSRNNDPGLALNRFRIQSGSDDASSLAIDSFVISADPAPVPEPSSIALVAVALGLAGWTYRRAS